MLGLLLQLTDDSSGETMMGETMMGETTVNETVTGVSNNRGSVDSMGNNGGMVSGGGVGDNGGSSVVGLSLIGHISNIAIIVVGMVLDVLDPAVGKVDGVGSGGGVTVTVLAGVEGGAGVVIGHGVVVSVDGGLVSVDGGGLVGGGRGVPVPGGVVSGGHSGEGENDENLKQYNHSFIVDVLENSCHMEF